MASAAGSLAEAGVGGAESGGLFFDPTATPTVAFRNCAALFKAISRGFRPGERQSRWGHNLFNRLAGGNSGKNGNTQCPQETHRWCYKAKLLSK